jgi:hypothetical protein
MEKPNVTPKNLSAVAREAKALVALAFRNGPIEVVHAGKACPTCSGSPEYSHITQEEMRSIMKAAVDRVYTYLLMKESDKAAYDALLSFAEKYTKAWDEPTLTKGHTRNHKPFPEMTSGYECEGLGETWCAKSLPTQDNTSIETNQ